MEHEERIAALEQKQERIVDLLAASLGEHIRCIVDPVGHGDPAAIEKYEIEHAETSVPQPHSGD